MKNFPYPGILSSADKAAFHVAVVAEDLQLPFDEGAKKAAFSLICSFMNKGVRVSIFTRYENPSLKNTFPLPENRFLLGSSFIHRLKTQAPDILLYIPASSGTIGAFTRAAMMKTQCPNTPLAMLNLQFRDLPAFARHIGIHRCADVIFAQSQASTDVFRSLGCKTVMLPGGVDLAIFKPVDNQEKHHLRSKYGFQDTDRIILHIGHCDRGRNVVVLARLAKSGFKVILVASTSTSIDRDLLAELRESGVTVITDFIESIQHFYQFVNCYLFPVFNAASAIDAPLSVLEAMACNLPVVTTRFGALPAMFTSGNGLYYANSDEEIISEIKLAMEDRDCKTREIVTPYSWDHAASFILETLKEIAGL